MEIQRQKVSNTRLKVKIRCICRLLYYQWHDDALSITTLVLKENDPVYIRTDKVTYYSGERLAPKIIWQKGLINSSVLQEQTDRSIFIGSHQNVSPQLSDSRRVLNIAEQVL